MFSVGTVKGRGAGAKLPGRRPPAHSTGRGPVNEGIMFGELSFLFFVSSWGVCVTGWEWMCECPCHQESAWGAAEARQERVIVEVVRKGIVVGRCWNICWTHLHIFYVSTEECEKASDVEQYWGTCAKLPGRRPPPHWTRRGQVNAGVMFGEFRILLFVCFRSQHGWMGMDVWVNVFTMPFLYEDSGPWRKMSRAWPPTSSITTSSGSTCPSHQESAWGAAEVRQERVIVEVVRKGIVVGKCWNMCWTHVQMFSVSTMVRRLPMWSSFEDHLPSFLTVAHHYDGQEEGQLNEGVMFGKLRVLLFVCLRSMHGNGCVSECLSLRCHSCAKTLDSGERCSR